MPLLGPDESARFELLGVSVSAVQIPQVIKRMESWIQARNRCHFIAVTGMHGLTEAQHDTEFKHILNSADLVVPDGMPLVWLGRLRGQRLRRRVYGPELMATFCSNTAHCDYRHFLYGGSDGVAEKLASVLQSRFKGLAIAGAICPPFRPLAKEEDDEIISRINESRPDVVWVGLSTPKQERWMFQHRHRLNAPVLVGVGAAFDFHAGVKTQAPFWMRESGFEWLFRLLQEPRRLWRRYLIGGGEFVYLVAMEQLGIRKWR